MVGLSLAGFVQTDPIIPKMCQISPILNVLAGFGSWVRQELGHELAIGRQVEQMREVEGPLSGHHPYLIPTAFSTCSNDPILSPA